MPDQRKLELRILLLVTASIILVIIAVVGGTIFYIIRPIKPSVHLLGQDQMKAACSLAPFEIDSSTVSGFRMAATWEQDDATLYMRFDCRSEPRIASASTLPADLLQHEIMDLPSVFEADWWRLPPIKRGDRWFRRADVAGVIQIGTPATTWECYLVYSGSKHALPPSIAAAVSDSNADSDFMPSQGKKAAFRWP